MKRTIPIMMMLLFILGSCSEDEIPIGDGFLLYKEDRNGEYCFNSIGLNVGGTQGLIDGKIESYGYDSTFVVAKMENDSYYFFKKSEVKQSPRPTQMVEGPLGADEFKKRASDLKLPPLIHFPPKSK